MLAVTSLARHCAPHQACEPLQVIVRVTPAQPFAALDLCAEFVIALARLECLVMRQRYHIQADTLPLVRA